MEPYSDACLRCGAPVSLSSRFLSENPIEVPGKGSLCPSCYRELSLEEYNSLFKS
ncbi:MAG: hypothetical protein PWP65_1338 [Clostridia bacterium]|nr:hypothetical protein [Clostridia bacterium]